MQYDNIKDFCRTGLVVTRNYEEQLKAHGYLPVEIKFFDVDMVWKVNKWCAKAFTMEHYLICGGSVWFDSEENRTWFILRWL